MKILKNTVMTCGLLAASASLRLFGQTESEPQGVVNLPSTAYQPGMNSSLDAGAGWATFPRRPVNAEHPLVVRFREAEPKDTAKLEDDLAVMSHLLRKALAEKFGTAQDQRNVLGVDISFAPGSQPIRTIYLDGFGALFLLDVDFPLHPSPKPESAPKEKPATDSTWEEARREYYGAPAARTSVAPAGAPYDERKVEVLKEALTEALRSAANIRGMNPDDFVSVCVAGGASSRALGVTIPTTAGEQFNVVEPNGPYYTVGEVATEKSFLTVRARKSDIDAVATGKITPDEFGKALTISSYLRTLVQGAGNGAMGSYNVGDGKQIWTVPNGFQQK